MICEDFSDCATLLNVNHVAGERVTHRAIIEHTSSIVVGEEFRFSCEPGAVKFAWGHSVI
jgi:hypothetical protein